MADSSTTFVALLVLVLIIILIVWLSTSSGNERGPRGHTGSEGPTGAGSNEFAAFDPVVLTGTTTTTGIAFPAAPTGAAWMVCTLIGAGGAGCQPITGTRGGGGGGGGAIVYNAWLPATGTYYYKVGAGATGGGNTGFAPSGESTIVYNDQFIPIIRAAGGNGASNVITPGAGGNGGAGQPAGLFGGAGVSASDALGGLGGGAGANIINGNTVARFGAHNFQGGDGGDAAGDGTSYGGGGGGGSALAGPVYQPGGSGANGAVFVQYA